MSKLFQHAITITVEEDMQHRPISFLYKGKNRKVEQIFKQWRVIQEWWKRTVEREYFQVGADAGIVCELYRDLSSGAWYLQRIYD